VSYRTDTDSTLSIMCSLRYSFEYRSLTTLLLIVVRRMNIVSELALLARVMSENSENEKMMNGPLRCQGRLPNVGSECSECLGHGTMKCPMRIASAQELITSDASQV
jgi:hypothetical protein